MKNKILIWVILMFTLMSFGFATDNFDYIIDSGDNFSIAIPCITENDVPCDTDTKCNVSLLSKDYSDVIIQTQMNNTGNIYLYSHNETLNDGEYLGVVACNDKGRFNGAYEFSLYVEPSLFSATGGCPISSRSNFRTIINIALLVGAYIAVFFFAGFGKNGLGMMTSLIVIFLGIPYLQCHVLIGGLITISGLILCLKFAFGSGN